MQKLFTKFILGIFSFAIGIAALTGCVAFHLQRNVEMPSNTKPVVERRLSTFVWGFVPAARIHQESVCPSARIESMDLHMSSSDVLISIATIGIYVPHHAEITCGSSL
jgi:hypothetical protein